MKFQAYWRRLMPLLLCGMLVGSQVIAAPDTAADKSDLLALSLDQAISMALDQGPAVKAVAYKSDAAAMRASAAGRSRWGRIDAVASVSRFDEDRLLVPMSSQLLAGGLPNAPFDRDQIHYGLAYQVPLYLGGKLTAGIQIARLEADRADALRVGTRWQVRFNVVSLYAGVQTLDGAIDAAQDLLKTLGAVQTRLELMVQTGKRPELDLLKVRDEVAEAQAELASLQAHRTKVAGLLLSLLGEDPRRAVAVTSLSDFAPELAVPTDSLSTLALASSPVRRAQLASRQAGKGIKAAHSEFLPSVVGMADYMGHHADSADSDPTTWQLSLGVKLPVFNGTSRFAALSAAKANQRAAEENLKLVRLQREADLNDGLARIQAARIGLDAAKARVATATEAARSEQIRYDSGASSIEDLLRARTREKAAHTALAQASGELRIATEQLNTVVEMEVIR